MVVFMLVAMTSFSDHFYISHYASAAGPRPWRRLDGVGDIPYVRTRAIIRCGWLEPTRPPIAISADQSAEVYGG